jgi:hypothetical protein
MTAEAVNNKDIFKVLADKAGSASVNKQFRAAVRETVIKGCDTLRLELAVCGASGSAGGEWRRGSLEDTLVSHWTPLKDAAGNVEWGVLVLSPSGGV